MHNDEANQAIKFGELLEQGVYTYDAYDHHGPTLYYLTLPIAWLRGQATLAATDEWTLRGLPVAFGAATILLLPLLSRGTGRTAVASAAVLMAVSPGMVFYSRMYIQESMFACFALAFAIALGRAVTEGGRRWPALAGVSAGLAIATKETSVIVIPAALAAGAVAWWSLGPARPAGDALATRQRRTAVVIGLATCAAVAVLFYSSFLTRPGDILGPLRAAPTYLERGVDPADHVHPWHYYLGILAWSSSGGLTWTEALVLGLAAVGAVTAWRRPNPTAPLAAFWGRFLTGNAALSLALFSAIPYKTPWNLLPFLAATIVAAGIGVAALARASAWRGFPALLAGVLAVGSAHLGWQAWRAAVVYAADPRNPYGLFTDGSGRGPHGGADPRPGRAARGRAEHARPGDCAAARAVAVALVSAGDAARGLLAGRRGRARAHGAGDRRIDGQHRGARRRAGRPLRAGVLRRPAGRPGDALRRAVVVGPVSGPGSFGRSLNETLYFRRRSQSSYHARGTSP